MIEAYPKMKIDPVTVSAMEITDIKGLDPVLVIWQDYMPGKGRLLVHCYGRAWSAYWEAMGDRDVRTFVAGASTDYVVCRMLSGVQSRRLDEKYLMRIIDVVRVAIKQQSVPA